MSGHEAEASSATAAQQWLFDTMGYLVIEDVLTKDTVAQINTLIDEHAAFKSNGKLVQEGSALAGSARADGRHTMSGMLGWPEPVAAPFRELLWHPKLVPVLQTVLGDGYRLDNGPLVMQNSPGGGGQRLHGGGFERDLAESYDYRNGRFYTGMCVLEVLLADQHAGAGGLCIVPGSHKSNMATPQEVKDYSMHRHAVQQVVAKAGDAILFPEAAIHGALPWQAEHERRLLLFRYTPGCMQFRPWFAQDDTPTMYEATYPDWLSELSPEQRSVLQAPWRGAHGVAGSAPEGDSGQRWTGGRPPAVAFWEDAREAAAADEEAGQHTAAARGSIATPKL